MEIDCLRNLIKENEPDFNEAFIHSVIVTHINNPESIYVRSAAHSKYIKNLEMPGPQLDQCEIEPYKIVTFKSSIKDMFVRGQICLVKETENAACIYACDYGFSEDVPFSNIFQSEYESVKSLARECKLIYCHSKDGTWDLGILKRYIGLGKAKISIEGRENNKLLITLYTETSSPQDVATLYSLAGCSVIGMGTPSINIKPEIRYFTYDKLEEGKVLTVQVLSVNNTDETFYCGQTENYKDYMAEKAFYNLQSNTTPSVTFGDLSEGDPVSVFIPDHGDYERAIVLTVHETGEYVTLKLIDLGGFIKTNFTNLKEMPNFFTRPGLAIHCCLDYSQMIDYKCKNFLVPDTKFKIKICKLSSSANEPNTVLVQTQTNNPITN